MYTFEDYLQRMYVIQGVQHLEIAHASHMLHHDQPQVLASMLTQFLSDASTNVLEMTA
jgi:pimeloyl-ACP methyl ester carboxylesterase